MLLELYGYDVAVAYSGPDGVKAAEDWHPNIILCDIGLPGLACGSQASVGGPGVKRFVSQPEA
jgi:CheY-like chemotaxis protein